MTRNYSENFDFETSITKMVKYVSQSTNTAAITLQLLSPISFCPSFHYLPLNTFHISKHFPIPFRCCAVTASFLRHFTPSICCRLLPGTA